MTAEQSPRVFLSHASEDKTFVRRLALMLHDNGIDTFFDEWEIGPGDSFRRKIEEGLRDCTHFIFVLSPTSMHKEWVNLEVDAAFVRKVAQQAKFFPILYRLPPEDAPPLVAGMLCVPIDDSLKDAWRLIREIHGVPRKPPVHPKIGYEQAVLADLHNVPEFPEHYVPRRQHLEWLKNTVLAPSHSTLGITGSTRGAGLLGMGGIGKSVLAMTLARDSDIRRSFADSVIWLSFGRQANVIAQQINLARALGEELTVIENWQDGRTQLSHCTVHKVCLIILDDVWEPWHAEAFTRLGEGCRLVVTTRDSAVLQKLGAREYRLDVLAAHDARKFLAKSAGWDEKQLPFEVYDVARRCGYLPLALAVVGALIRTERFNWKQVRDRIEAADIGRLRAKLPNCEHEGVLAALEISVEALPEPYKFAFLNCAVFPEDVAIPEATLVTLWSETFPDPEDARDAAQRLFERSVIDRDDQRCYRLHDLYHDYLQVRVDDITVAHRRFITAYGKQRHNGWATIPDDGYFFQHFPFHLFRSGSLDTLQSLLLDYDWVKSKIEATNVYALISDYDFLLRSSEIIETHDVVREASIDKELRTIQDALRLSTHVLVRDPGQVRAQLWARVFFEITTRDTPFLRSLLEKEGVWLRLMTPSVNLPHGPLARALTGHQEGVLSVAVTDQGNLAITGSQDGTVKVWDLATAAELRTLSGHQHAVHSVAVTPDGRRVLSASSDGTAKAWDLASGQVLQSFSGHRGMVLVITAAHDGKTAVTGDKFGIIKRWELESGKEIGTFVGHSDRVWKLSITKDGTRLLSASSDNTLRIWDVEATTELYQRNGDPGLPGTTVAAVLAIAPDGKSVISASDETTLRIWSLGDPSQLGIPLRGHTQLINDVSITSNSKRAVSCADDSMVRVWDLSNHNEVGAFQHARDVTSVAVMPDGKHVLAASWDNTVRVWGLDLAPRQITSSPDHAAYINLIKVSPDGRLAVSAADDCTLKIWDLSTANNLAVLEGHKGPVWDATFTADGCRLLSASWDATLKIWDVRTGKLLHTLRGHIGAVYSVCISPDGRFAYSGSTDQTVRQWDLARGISKVFMGHGKRVWSIATAIHGDLALSSSWDKTIKVWDVKMGAVKRTLSTGSSNPCRVVVSHDNRLIVSALGTPRHVFDLAKSSFFRQEAEILESDIGDTGLDEEWYTWKDISQVLISKNNGVRVWNLESGELIAALTSDEKPVEALAITQEPPRIVYASGHIVYVADLPRADYVRKLHGHFDYINAVDVVPDGNQAISVANDSSVRLWDLNSGTCLASFTADNPLTSGAIVPSAKKVVVGDEAGRMHFLDVENLAANILDK